MYDVKLTVDAGEYTLDVGLAKVDQRINQRRGRIPIKEVRAHMHLLYHVRGVAAFSILHPLLRSARTLSHYGVADLPSRFEVGVAVEKVC